MKAELIRQLKGEEGEVLSAYQDHLGYWTIGIGRLIDKRKGGGITPEESAYLLGNDIDKRIAQLDKALPWWGNLSEPRMAVMLQMCFQLGLDGLLEFKNTLNLIKTGQYVAAAGGMMQSLWAKQTPLRAQRLADQMASGKWIYKPGT